MKLGITVSAEHIIHCPVGEDLIRRLLGGIYRYTRWTYSCTRTEAGYLLKPNYRRMPFTHSFVPEISLAVSQKDDRTVLQLQGRPRDFNRGFMCVWFGVLLLMVLLELVAIPWPDKLWGLMIGAIMGVGGYLSCKSFTRSGFERILKAIQKELP